MSRDAYKNDHEAHTGEHHVTALLCETHGLCLQKEMVYAALNLCVGC